MYIRYDILSLKMYIHKPIFTYTYWIYIYATEVISIKRKLHRKLIFRFISLTRKNITLNKQRKILSLINWFIFSRLWWKFVFGIFLKKTRHRTSCSMFLSKLEWLIDYESKIAGKLHVRIYSTLFWWNVIRCRYKLQNVERLTKFILQETGLSTK